MSESEPQGHPETLVRSGLRVLVVDPDLSVCLHISRGLRGIASTVIARHDVSGALDALHSDPFDVVIVGVVDAGPGSSKLTRECAERRDVKHLITLGDHEADPATRCLSADHHLPALWYDAERCSAVRRASVRRVPAVVPDRVGDGERPAVRRPRRIVVLTGWRDGALDAIELGTTTLLQKPCAMPELRTAVLEPKQSEEA